MTPRHPNAVVLVCDANYLPPALYVAERLLEGPWTAFDVLILLLDGGALPEQALDPRIQVVPFSMDMRLADKSTNKRRSSAVYARLGMGAFLAGQYARILYMDCDVWVEGTSLEPLFTVDMQGKPVAAVRDAAEVLRLGTPQWADYKARIGLRPEQAYFNSGVMLIDLEAFTARRIGEQATEYVATGQHLGGLDDQTAINVAVAGDWLELSPLWNWMYAPRLRLTEEVRPHLIHFIGGNKPWADTKGRHHPKYRADMVRRMGAMGVGDFVKPRPLAAEVRFRLRALGQALDTLRPDSRDERVRRYLRDNTFAA